MDFGFHENPFSDVPDLRFTYRHRIFQDVCADLMFVRMSNRRGIALIEGPAGSGKTTLLATLDANRKPGESSVTLSGHRRLSVAKMIDICAEALGFPIDRTLDPTDLESRLSAMNARLTAMSDKGGVILLIDRAEMLSAEFLEDLPRLLALGADGGAVIHVVLAVTCEDDADPLPSAFNAVHDQIHFRSWLGSMSEEEVARYVSHRMMVAGDSRGKLYSDDGLDALNFYSGGIPGRVNAISRQCIEFLTAEFMEEADAATVQRAADFLGLKPRARVGRLAAGPSAGAPLPPAKDRATARPPQARPESSAADDPATHKLRSPFKKLRKRSGEEAAVGRADTAVPRPERSGEDFDPGGNVIGLPTRNGPAGGPPQQAPMEARLLQAGGRGAEARTSAAARKARPAQEPTLSLPPRRDPDDVPTRARRADPRQRPERPRDGYESDRYGERRAADAWQEPDRRMARAEEVRERRQERLVAEDRPTAVSTKEKFQEIQKRRPYLLSRLGVVTVLILLGVLLLGVYGRPQRSVEPIAAKPPPQDLAVEAPENQRLSSLENRVADLASKLNQVQVERDSLVATLSALQLADQEAKLMPGGEEAEGLGPGGNDLVQDLQKQLTALGLDPGQTDGRLGQKTLDAIGRYQEQQGLPVDRQATRALRDHMRALGLLKQAVVLYHDKDYRAAEDAYDDVVHLQPGDGDARYFRGLARLKLGEKAAAVQDMNWRGPADPRLPMASFPPARVYYIQERLRTLGFDPGRGDGLYDTGTKNAINAYQRVQGLTVNGEPSLDLLRHLEVYSHHAEAIDAYRRGDTERALMLYDLVLSLDSSDAEAYFNRGLAYRRAGQLDKAYADYTKAVQEDPKLAKAYYERGSLAFEAGRYGPAIGDYISAAQAWIFDS